MVWQYSLATQSLSTSQCSPKWAPRSRVRWVLPVKLRGTGGLTNGGSTHDAGETESDEEDVHGGVWGFDGLERIPPRFYVSSIFSCEDEKPDVRLALPSLPPQNPSKGLIRIDPFIRVFSLRRLPLLLPSLLAFPASNRHKYS